MSGKIDKLTRRADEAAADSAKFYAEMKLAQDRANLCDLRARNADTDYRAQLRKTMDAERAFEVERQNHLQTRAELTAIRARSVWRVIWDAIMRRKP